MAKKTIPKIKTVDQELAEHLESAEEHLIAAVKLFARRMPPNRSKDYLPRLVRAQEMVTTLFREELIRIRGPLKVAVKRRVKK